ncbi:hypothetical protein Cadr_000030656 [Camelus dromedarius]|uniref:Uncharacterized protein n=1 Tax=Camelus dromedarius TaxID=9838 RepID=A0A5N4C4H6_CAMDR|nr:hypothetical protein Cadr_000030656 [Camelus dromedarius]
MDQDEAVMAKIGQGKTAEFTGCSWRACQVWTGGSSLNSRWDSDKASAGLGAMPVELGGTRPTPSTATGDPAGRVTRWDLCFPGGRSRARAEVASPSIPEGGSTRWGPVSPLLVHLLWKEADLAASTAATRGPAASSQNSPQFVMHLIKGGKARPGGFNDLSVVGPLLLKGDKDEEGGGGTTVCRWQQGLSGKRGTDEIRGPRLARAGTLQHPSPAPCAHRTAHQAVGRGWGPRPGARGDTGGCQRASPAPPLLRGQSHLALLSPCPDTLASDNQLMTFSLVPECQLEPWGFALPLPPCPLLCTAQEWTRPGGPGGDSLSNLAHCSAVITRLSLLTRICDGAGDPPGRLASVSYQLVSHISGSFETLAAQEVAPLVNQPKQASCCFSGNIKQALWRGPHASANFPIILFRAGDGGPCWRPTGRQIPPRALPLELDLQPPSGFCSLIHCLHSTHWATGLSPDRSADIQCQCGQYGTHEESDPLCLRCSWLSCEMETCMRHEASVPHRTDAPVGGGGPEVTPAVSGRARGGLSGEDGKVCSCASER